MDNYVPKLDAPHHVGFGVWEFTSSLHEGFQYSKGICEWVRQKRVSLTIPCAELDKRALSCSS